MALKNQTSHNILRASLLLIIFGSFLINPTSALAMGNVETALPDFVNFVQAVQNGHHGVLRGVYVPNVLALPVVQQPVGYPGYVSQKDDEVTQFSMASRAGNVGLLAHNQLAGKSFSALVAGQEVLLVFGDGSIETFVITKVLRYQALQPNSTTSEFRGLEDNTTISAEQLFKQVYLGDRHVTFQTCIANNGMLIWGRLFVIAEPKSKNSGGELHWGSLK